MKPINIASYFFLPTVGYLVITKQLPQFALPLFGLYAAIAMTVEDNYVKRLKK